MNICQSSLLPCYSMESEDVTGYYDRNMSRINKKINEEIKQDKKRSRNRHKILLLGCGEAGKVNKLFEFHILGNMSMFSGILLYGISFGILIALLYVIQNTHWSIRSHGWNMMMIIN